MTKRRLAHILFSSLAFGLNVYIVSMWWQSVDTKCKPKDIVCLNDFSCDMNFNMLWFLTAFLLKWVFSHGCFYSSILHTFCVHFVSETLSNMIIYLSSYFWLSVLKENNLFLQIALLLTSWKYCVCNRLTAVGLLSYNPYNIY